MVAGGAGSWWTTPGVRRVGAAASLSLALAVTACGDDTDERNAGGDTRTAAESGPTSSAVSGDAGLPACDSVDHVVIFSIFGTVTDGGDDELEQWIGDGAAPPPRSGAAEVVRAYQDLGYDILYVTSEPETVEVNGQPLVEALTTWLGANGFPVGDGAEIWVGNEDRDISIALIEHLALMSNAGVEIGAAYASDPAVVFPLSTSGISGDNVFAVGDAAADATVTSLPDADMNAHLPEVEDLDPICE